MAFLRCITLLLIAALPSWSLRSQEVSESSGSPATEPTADLPLSPVAAETPEASSEASAELAADKTELAADKTDEAVPSVVATNGEEPVPVKLTPEEEVAVKAFVEARSNWADSLVEMKTIMIHYGNQEDSTPEALQRYRDAREKGRRGLRETFVKAIELYKVRNGDFESAQMMATTLEYFESQSIYENCYEAARLMIDAEVKAPFLYLIAARSALLEGQYDQVIPLYKTFVDTYGVEKLENVDKMVSGLVDLYPAMWERELAVRKAEAEADDLPRVLLQTSRGEVVLELYENQAPNTVANFIHLVESGFYDGTDFYQVVDDFIAQGGDPVGDGSGTADQFIPDEHQRDDRRQAFRGTLLMAKMPDPRDKLKLIPDSASAQFTIALMPILREDETQTVFGRVIDGMDVVCNFRRMDPTEKKEKSVQMPPDRIMKATVIRKRNHEYKPEYTRVK